MLKQYPKFKTGEIEKISKRLSVNEKKDYEDYFKYRQAKGINSIERIKDIRRVILQLRAITEKPINKLNINEITELTITIKNSYFGDYQKNEVITVLKNFLKWKVPDWSSKLKLDDISLVREPVSKRIITDKDLLSKADVEKLIRHETKLFWKAFLLVQYEGGLRTKETRYLKWEDIAFNSDGDLSEINIYATKTKKTRSIFIKEATFYLQKLKEEQINLNQKGVYVFHSKTDMNAPMNQATISLWMKRLSERVLGRSVWNYLLRHSRGSELYELSKLNKINKDIAVEFMGHSEKMSQVYTHLSSKKIKKMMREQVYHLEVLPEEKKVELETRIEEQDKILRDVKNSNDKLAQDNRKMNRQMKEMLELVNKMTSSVKGTDRKING